MSVIQHLSMRVPWRDRPWDGFVCDHPRGNSSCTLLANIGPKRDDDYETEHAGTTIDILNHDRLPCLSERATFMSASGYTVVKEHPYRFNKALSGHLQPTTLAVPPYAFEALPFRWLNRSTLADDVGTVRIADYDQSLEDRADDLLNFTAPWLMDSRNQRAAIEEFFDPVRTGDSLVFIYLKHSPLQEQRTDRLLVGAARISKVTPPRMWEHAGTPPFASSMWETVVEHSLRPDQADGVLLPYQALVPLLDAGADVDAALAWAPQGRDTEFSYVTEHLSDDAALEALASLERAAAGCRALGLPTPTAGTDWLAAQTERLWQLRGPTPGLAGVLEVLGVQRPHAAARDLATAAVDADGQDPWPLLEQLLADPKTAPPTVAGYITSVTANLWRKLPSAIPDAHGLLRLVSAFDIDAGQVRMLLEGDTDVALAPAELLENPYFAATCTYGDPRHVPFTTIDRAVFPPPHVTWVPPIPEQVALEGNTDPRRLEALITDVVERQCAEGGDTLVPSGEAVEAANGMALTQQPNLNQMLLLGADLDHASLVDRDVWSPLTSRLMAGDVAAFKLTRYEETSQVIRDWVDAQQARPRLGTISNARAVLDAALAANADVTASPADSPADGTAGAGEQQVADELEEQARTEKAAGLSELHDSPLSVLIGPAGTGKTTLLRALVDYPGVANGDVLLLAPTGKARVQLQQKVGPAKTLASWLLRSGRYDLDTGRYLVAGDHKRSTYGLVVIDEASMLTEEMLAATLDALAGATRLVLVGDPRQLPPIGSGRPFVDLVAKLRPAEATGQVRVGPGYVELQVPRRQLPDGSHGARRDLELAAWFGDGVRGSADDEVWAALGESPDQGTVAYVPWGGRPATQVLTDALQAELDWSGDPDPERAFALTYGGSITDKGYLNWELGAGEHAEDWQILSPTRSRVFGSLELNRHIKRTWRIGETERAQRYARANIASPVGPELIVRGDKVMQIHNRTMKPWKPDHPDKALNYVANGEIGVGLGRVVPTKSLAKNKLTLQVEFSSQPGFQYRYWPTTGEDVWLELAWAVTVHKSQGSEFAKTFLMLPANAPVSRELLYTALTRQRDRVVIMHEGTLAELRELADPARSETARRLTDLFATPDPVQLEHRGRSRRYERSLMHVDAHGTAMASKNEVIISGLLDQVVPGRWVYEQPFTGADGRTVLPDFTIPMADGRVVLWEHAGMLDVPDYARKWELKQAWYAENQVLPHEAGGGTRGILLVTDDRHGADAQAWLTTATEVIGYQSHPSGGSGDGPGDGPSDGSTSAKGAARKAKKAAPKPVTRSSNGDQEG